MAESWCEARTWQEDPTLNTMVQSFLEHLPSIIPSTSAQDLGSPNREDLEVHRCVTSFTNHVIRIRVKQLRHIGFIVKMASTKSGTEELLLPEERGLTEHNAYVFFNSLVPGCTPTSLFYDHHNRILCTQELTGHLPLSGAVLSGQFSDRAARALGVTLASLHSATLLTAAKGGPDPEQLTQQFPSREAMLSMIRAYHFERPFDPNDTGRRCQHAVLRMLPEILEDAAIMAARQEARNSFTNDLDCLIHGDLHIESVLVSEDGNIKVVDTEFTRVGPCAFDMGLLLATLLAVFHRYRHMLQGAGQASDEGNHTPEADTQALEKLEHNCEDSQQICGCLNNVHRKTERVSETSANQGCLETGKKSHQDCDVSNSTPSIGHVICPSFENQVQCSNLQSSQKNQRLFHFHDDRTTTSSEDLVSKDEQGFQGSDGNPHQSASGPGVDKRMEKSRGTSCAVEDQEPVSIDIGDVQDELRRHPAHDILLKCTLLLDVYTDKMSASARQSGGAHDAEIFQRQLLQNIATFTGCELLAWVIGPPHMDFMDSCPAAEVDCVLTAHRLLTNRFSIATVQDFVRLLT